MDMNTTVTTAATAVVPFISTGGSEILVQLFIIVITSLLSVMSYYGIKWLKTSVLAKKYNIDTERVEHLLEKAVIYASGYGETKARDYITKKNLSIKYLESVDPALVKQYGDKLNDMIKRKAFEMEKEGWVDTDGDGVPDAPPPSTTAGKKA